MLTNRVWRNPIITSEMKIKMRGWRTALGVAGYLGVMLLIGFLYYLAFVQYSWESTVNARQEAGMQIYSALAIVQFGLILLITPAQTAGAISGEREKQTLSFCFPRKFLPSALFSKADFLHVLYPASDSYLHTLVQPCVFIRRRYPRRYDEAVPFISSPPLR